MTMTTWMKTTTRRRKMTSRNAHCPSQQVLIRTTPHRFSPLFSSVWAAVVLPPPTVVGRLPKFPREEGMWHPAVAVALLCAVLPRRPDPASLWRLQCSLSLLYLLLFPQHHLAPTWLGWMEACACWPAVVPVVSAAAAVAVVVVFGAAVGCGPGGQRRPSCPGFASGGRPAARRWNHPHSWWSAQSRAAPGDTWTHTEPPLCKHISNNSTVCFRFVESS